MDSLQGCDELYKVTISLPVNVGCILYTKVCRSFPKGKRGGGGGAALTLHHCRYVPPQTLKKYEGSRTGMSVRSFPKGKRGGGGGQHSPYIIVGMCHHTKIYEGSRTGMSVRSFPRGKRGGGAALTLHHCRYVPHKNIYI